jgi:hypothetical protein
MAYHIEIEDVTDSPIIMIVTRPFPEIILEGSLLVEVEAGAHRRREADSTNNAKYSIDSITALSKLVDC